MKKPVKTGDPLGVVLVSRAAMLVLGLGLLAGSYGCFTLAFSVGDAMDEVRADAEDGPRRTRVRARGAEAGIRVLPMLGGGVLGVAGLALTTAGLLPGRVLERLSH